VEATIYQLDEDNEALSQRGEVAQGRQLLGEWWVNKDLGGCKQACRHIVDEGLPGVLRDHEGQSAWNCPLLMEPHTAATCVLVWHLILLCLAQPQLSRLSPRCYIQKGCLMISCQLSWQRVTCTGQMSGSCVRLCLLVVGRLGTGTAMATSPVLDTMGGMSINVQTRWPPHRKGSVMQTQQCGKVVPLQGTAGIQGVRSTPMLVGHLPQCHGPH
jgi:hypothetical protein